MKEAKIEVSQYDETRRGCSFGSAVRWFAVG